MAVGSRRLGDGRNLLRSYGSGGGETWIRAGAGMPGGGVRCRLNVMKAAGNVAAEGVQ